MYTYGEEYIISKTGVPYMGSYNKGPNNNLYTGKIYKFGVSKKLSEISKLQDYDNESSYRYDQLRKNRRNKKFVCAWKLTANQITDKNIEDGFIDRYFVVKTNSNLELFEVNKKNFDEAKLNVYYTTAQVRWYIKGDNVEDKNKESVLNASKKIKSLYYYFDDFSEFSLEK